MLSMRVLLPCCVGGESGTEQMVRAHHAPVACVGGDPTPCLGISGCSCEQNITGPLSWVTEVELFKIWLLNNWSCLGQQLCFLLFSMVIFDSPE